MSEVRAAAKATPIRNLIEIAVLAAYLVVVPPQFEALLATFGLAAEGITQVVGTSVLYLGFALVAVAIVKLRGQSLAQLGLRWPQSWVKSTLIGLAVAVAFYVAVEVMLRNGIMTRDASVLPQWRDNLPLLLAWVAMIVIFTGVIEEFIYRGFVMDRIAGAFGYGRLGWTGALVGQAALFGLAHAYGDMELILFAGAFAIAYGIMYLSDGKSLWAPIVAHIVYDVARVALKVLHRHLRSAPVALS